MKSLILISTLAVSLLIANAALPKPATIFSPDRVDKISRSDLELLANSAVLQRAAARYVYAQSDANKSGYLTLAELNNAYSLMAPLTGWITYDADFVQNEFNQGNFITRNTVISLDEFAFLFNRLFKFLNSNPIIFTELQNTQEWDQQMQIAMKLDQIPTDIFYYDFPDLYQQFNTDGNSGVDLNEFKSGLQSLGDSLGVNLYSDDNTARDVFQLMLPSSKGLVTETKLRNTMVPFLQNYLSHARQFLPIVEYPGGGDEEVVEEEVIMEEEYEDD